MHFQINLRVSAAESHGNGSFWNLGVMRPKKFILYKISENLELVQIFLTTKKSSKSVTSDRRYEVLNFAVGLKKVIKTCFKTPFKTCSEAFFKTSKNCLLIYQKCFARITWKGGVECVSAWWFLSFLKPYSGTRWAIKNICIKRKKNNWKTI